MVYSKLIPSALWRHLKLRWEAGDNAGFIPELVCHHIAPLQTKEANDTTCGMLQGFRKTSFFPYHLRLQCNVPVQILSGKGLEPAKSREGSLPLPFPPYDHAEGRPGPQQRTKGTFTFCEAPRLRSQQDKGGVLFSPRVKQG